MTIKIRKRCIGCQLVLAMILPTPGWFYSVTAHIANIITYLLNISSPFISGMYGLLFFFMLFGDIAPVWFIGLVFFIFLTYHTLMAVIIWPVGRRISRRWFVF